MQDNLAIWNSMSQPPSHALKTIQGGRLKGKTDINPQWRYQIMTETFGICGIGWKYEVVRVWNETISSGEMFAFAEIKLYVRHDGQWGDAIPGYGGSMLLEKEREGLHASDEGYKMAITDALSVAMKMLGVAADIYAGLFDGSKYSNEKPNVKQEPKEDKQSDHWCKIHNLAFDEQKKGNETWYSHKIPGGGWCNEGKKKDSPATVSEPSIEVVQSTTETTKEETSGNLPDGGIDMSWVIDSANTLNTLKWNIKTYIKDTYNVATTGTLGDVVNRLNKEQQAELCKEIQERLDMK